MPWAKEDIALSGRAHAVRIGVHGRAESPMVSIAQVGTLGVLMRFVFGVYERAESPMVSIAQVGTLGIHNQIELAKVELS